MQIVKPSFEILTPIDGKEILQTLEKVGRTCYKSEDKITDDSCVGFVERIIGRGHEAVIEHFNVTVRLTNDRGVSHEEVRHRVASFAQESTRYCNYSKDKFGNSITYIDLAGGIALDPVCKKLPAEQIALIYQEWLEACSDAERHYFNMLSFGASPQIARSVLNNSTKTEICITANIREWRHLFKLRTSLAAHPQMREIMIPLLKAFKEAIPVLFDDIEIDEEALAALDNAEIQPQKKDTKVVCISGKAQNGKDTSAALMKELLEKDGAKVLIAHYGDLVKYVCKTFFDWDGNKDEKGRTILQHVGTDIVRARRPNFWVDFILDILNLFDGEWDYVLIPDCRFDNEIKSMKDDGFDTVSLRVVRDGFDNGLTPEQQAHPSETALDNFPFDYVIHNVASIEYLRNLLEGCVEEWRAA